MARFSDDAPAHLEALLNACVVQSHAAPITLGQFVQRLGAPSYGLVCITLSLPLLLPVSVWPLSTVGGGCFVVLGWQLMRGRTTIMLPERLQRITVSVAVWRRSLQLWQRVYRLCRSVTRPRLQRWAHGQASSRVRGLLMLLAGLLMIVPLPGIPFDNFFPACTIICTALAELEEDGLMLLAAMAGLLLGLLYIALIVAGVLAVGSFSLRAF